MSWAKDDPEGWMRVCRRGVMKKLEYFHLQSDGCAFAPITTMQIESVLHSLHTGDTEAQKIWDALMSWANDEICVADRDRFFAHIDDAMNQSKAAREKG